MQGQGRVVEFDMSTYAARKEKGGVSVQKIAKDLYQIISRAFDPTTGEEIQPQVIALKAIDIDTNIEILNAQIDTLQKRIQGLEKLKVDISTLATVK